MHAEVSKTNSLDLANFLNVNVKVNVNWNTRREKRKYNLSQSKMKERFIIAIENESIRLFHSSAIRMQTIIIVYSTIVDLTSTIFIL